MKTKNCIVKSIPPSAHFTYNTGPKSPHPTHSSFITSLPVDPDEKSYSVSHRYTRHIYLTISMTSVLLNLTAQLPYRQLYCQWLTGWLGNQQGLDLLEEILFSGEGRGGSWFPPSLHWRSTVLPMKVGYKKGKAWGVSNWKANKRREGWKVGISNYSTNQVSVIILNGN